MILLNYLIEEIELKNLIRINRGKEKGNQQRNIHKINKGIEEKRQKGSVLLSCKLDDIPIQNISVCIW